MHVALRGWWPHGFVLERIDPFDEIRHTAPSGAVGGAPPVPQIALAVDQEFHMRRHRLNSLDRGGASEQAVGGDRLRIGLGDSQVRQRRCRLMGHFCIRCHRQGDDLHARALQLRRCGIELAQTRQRTGIAEQDQQRDRPVTLFRECLLMRMADLEGEIGGDDGPPGFDVRGHECGTLGIGLGAQESDYIPSLGLAQLIGKTRHRAAHHPMADPPEQSPLAVAVKMRPGQIGRSDRQRCGSRAVAITVGAVTADAVLGID